MSGRRCLPAADLPPDDLLLDVFLRLPPEPGHLHAASLVCRRWRRLVRDPAFLRRFRQFHRTPPVLGYYQNSWAPHRRVHFFSAAAARPARLPPPRFLQGVMSWVLDCRHGRALLYDHGDGVLLVWDPMVEEALVVSPPPELSELEDFTGVIVCACAAGHDDCHSSPFRIVYVENLDDDDDDEYTVSACIFSSETGVWGEWVSIKAPSHGSLDTSAMVGDSLYWKLINTDNVLGFGLHSQSLDLIQLPPGVRRNYLTDIQVMRAENGGVGFAGIDRTRIDFWSWKIDGEGVARWALLRVIDMAKLTLSGVPAGDTLLHASVAGFAEDSQVLFLHSKAGMFMINLRSMELKKVPQTNGVPIVYPYASFYTRGRDIVGIDDRDG